MDVNSLLARLSFAGSPRGQAGTAANDGDHCRMRNVCLLAIDGGSTDWAAHFEGQVLADGRAVDVVQAGWEALLVTAEGGGPLAPGGNTLVHIRAGGSPRGGGAAKRKGPASCIRPDFVLVREECRGAYHTQDWKNALFGLMFGNVPAMNSLHSIYCFLERPCVQAQLHRISASAGPARFPVVAQQYFATSKEMMYTSTFPAVAKVGHAHAGMGKMCVHDHHDFEDFRTVVAMTDGKYCTVEPFIDGAYDVRLQKIGDHCRAFKRTAMSGNWKTNMGTSTVEELPMTPEYAAWLELAAGMFGGLDICTVDAIHDAATGKEVIMEVNGTSSGLCPQHANEDNGHIRDLCMRRMNTELPACAPH